MRALALFLAVASGTAYGAEPRRSVWSVGVSGQRHSLKAGDGNEILGNSGAFQLGYGFVAQSWFLNLSLDVLLGPYEPTREGQINVDYLGTGFTLWTGVSAQTLDLRSQAGGYGFALGVSYADAVGRAIGRNRDEDDPPPSELIDDYVLRVTNFSLLPAIFFSWLKEARPRGNTPELLATRVEGYFLTLGMAMPIMVSYNARYSLRTKPAPVATPAEAQEPAKGPQSVEEKGRMRGYSVLVSLTAMLGT